MDPKHGIRQEILTLLRKQKEEDRLRKSRVIAGKLLELPEFKGAETIFFYASFDGEVETFEMIKQAKKLRKRIALPVILKLQKMFTAWVIEDLERDLEVGSYGIKQPKKGSTQEILPEQLDLVVVPGVAFDKRNHRLGRGAGYYDRFLRILSPKTPTVGLAFDFQIVDSLPNHSHDVPVSQVLVN